MSELETPVDAIGAAGAALGDGEVRHSEIAHRVHAHLELVGRVASHVVGLLGKRVSFDELQSAGREGLLDAARRYDPARGVPFRAYASIRIRGAIYDHVRKLSALSRRHYAQLKSLEFASWALSGKAEFFLGATNGSSNPVRTRGIKECDLDAQLSSAAMAMVASLSVGPDVGEGDDEEQSGDEDPEQCAAQGELFRALRDAVAELEGDEAEIIRLCYYEDKSIREAAECLRVNKVWAFRLHSRTILRLSKRMRRLC